MRIIIDWELIRSASLGGLNTAVIILVLIYILFIEIRKIYDTTINTQIPDCFELMILEEEFTSSQNYSIN